MRAAKATVNASSIAAFVVGLLLATTARPAPTLENPRVLECEKAKAKAAGRKAAALLKAVGKNISKNPDTKLEANISRADSKFTKAFNKAESKGGCLTNGDVVQIGHEIDLFVASVEGHIDIKCGDNVQVGSEQCDGTDDVLCPGACFPAGGANECRCDFCGNGTAGALEQCDGDDDAACGTAGCAGDCTCKLCGNNAFDLGEQCDGTEDAACPGLCLANCTCPVPVCGNGSVEAGEQCDPPGVTGTPCTGEQICNGFCECVTEVGSCSCGWPTPTVFGFTDKAPISPNCGTTDGTVNPDLACLGLYIGGGSGDLPVPTMSPDEGTSLFNVAFCDGTGITLSARTEAETGSQLNCSEGPHPCSETSSTCLCSETQTQSCTVDSDCPLSQTCQAECLFAAPLTIVNTVVTGLSTCIVNTFSQDAVGGVDCGSGRSFIDQPLNARVHLTGSDQSPSTPGHQSCPICAGGTLGVADSGTCEGGPNNGDPCMPQSTPYDMGSCCTGSVGNASCTTDTDCGPRETCTAGCTGYPTSHDCPPSPNADIGVIPIPFALTTGSSSASDAGSQICRFCRDVDPGPGLGDTGTKCFEGDPRVAGRVCPDSAIIACTQAQQSGCGDAVPCRTDSDCVAPYETCEQRNPGAFRDASVKSITLTGSAPGDLTDHAAHTATVVSTFCIQSSFTEAIDASSDIGGPGAVSLQGEARLF